jgi:hypothetical protein
MEEMSLEIVAIGELFISKVPLYVAFNIIENNMGTQVNTQGKVTKCT